MTQKQFLCGFFTILHNTNGHKIEVCRLQHDVHYSSAYMVSNVIFTKTYLEKLQTKIKAKYADTLVNMLYTKVCVTRVCKLFRSSMGFPQGKKQLPAKGFGNMCK